ncbi:hypothetical protein CDAR_502331 [Caerostris darwini]|uniref:Retrovirus-related Pol polyprotein from type-1 retrotransposable element R2 n=1 Tax=Caerostris darwini TaxID=1538125 RepID=A0AAV4MY51_9ARAC|nr:retrovirus-related Pol polyprotein from type-1 retrotransposable element R2 [Caerostris darwini]GIY43156.1 hypothetical protein CDAR_502331 [Caerostris darwini]
MGMVARTGIWSETLHGFDSQQQLVEETARHEGKHLEQVRTDTFPTRAALLRGGRSGTQECRLCRFPHETLRHLLSLCPALHGQIIRRHNRIVDLLASKAGEIGWRVRKEFRCRLESGETRVPDLIIHDGGGRAIVVDVAITYETEQPDVFERAYEAKVRKYECLRDYLKAERLGESVSVHGFVLGSRGAFPEINDPVLKDIGIRSWHFKAMLSRRFLQMSVDILCQLGVDTPDRWSILDEQYGT